MKSLFIFLNGLLFVGFLRAQDCRIFIDVGDCSTFNPERSYLFKDSIAELFVDHECLQEEIDSIVMIANGKILQQDLHYESWLIRPEEVGSILCEAIFFRDGVQHAVRHEFNVVIPPLIEICAVQSESDPTLITAELIDRNGNIVSSKFTTCFCEYSIVYKDGHTEEAVGSSKLILPEEELDKIKEIRINGILVLSLQYNRTQWIVKGKCIVKL